MQRTQPALLLGTSSPPQPIALHDLGLPCLDDPLTLAVRWTITHAYACIKRSLSRFLAPLTMMLELCAADPYEKIMEGVKTAMYAGQETLDGGKAHHLKFTQDQFD